MCFSATASFTAAGALGALGVVSMTRSSSGSYRLFAATPLLFGAQQASEGFVWLSMNDPGKAALNHFGVAAFLGLALVAWPIWCPLSLRAGEQNASRRRILTGLSLFGGAVAVGALILLMRYQPMAIVAERSIRYDRAGTTDLARDTLILLAYFVATVAPLFVSTIKFGRTIGMMLVVSLVAARLIERDSLTSVWCFFASILSGLVIVAVTKEQRAEAGSLVQV